MKSSSAAIRERLSHPVIDGDGHIVEFVPALLDYMRAEAGPKVFERYYAGLKSGGQLFDGDRSRSGKAGWYDLTPQQRRERRLTRPSFWGFVTDDPLARATTMLPDLFRARLDELGLDYAVLYTTMGLYVIRDPDEEIRRHGCRALNQMYVDMYGKHADRMTVAAVIPMFTPDEAIDELEFAVKTLGMKAVMIGGCIRRPVKDVARKAPEAAGYATWMDVLAMGSDYDYDPVWQKCVDLKVAPTAHSGTFGWGARSSPENFVYNHIGSFAAGGEAFCKALVLGGVTQRFPTLRFAFLEGGVGWASNLYNDLVEHWEKRNVKSMREYLDPDLLDRPALRAIFEKWGGKLTEGRLDRLGEYAGAILPVENPAEIDDFAAVKIERARDIYDLFVPNFFFGCEADDRMTSLAFNTKLNHFGAKLQPIFSSDVGHFDVRDITATVSEAYELVEHGLIDDDDFREFTFGNAVKLQAGMNPDFFKGTKVEDAARNYLRDASPVETVH